MASGFGQTQVDVDGYRVRSFPGRVPFGRRSGFGMRVAAWIAAATVACAALALVSPAAFAQDGRCQGSNACVNSTAAEFAPERACNGASACMDNRLSAVGKGSCNGEDACYRAATELWRRDTREVAIENVRVGRNSCNGQGACYLLQGSVGDNSCNGPAFICFRKKNVGDCEFNAVPVPACG